VFLALAAQAAPQSGASHAHIATARSTAVNCTSARLDRYDGAPLSKGDIIAFERGRVFLDAKPVEAMARFFLSVARCLRGGDRRSLRRVALGPALTTMPAVGVGGQIDNSLHRYGPEITISPRPAQAYWKTQVSSGVDVHVVPRSGAAPNVLLSEGRRIALALDPV